MHDHQARRIEIYGAVQGVGFRPFVYRLAKELGLTGWVLNDSRGVFIEVEGSLANLDAFLARLPQEKPVHAQIHDLKVVALPAGGCTDFTIRHSEAQGTKTVLILPDLASCPACLADVLDPANRRYAYPFTNCTNCGPRFSIVQALPYDRPNTTLHGFPLCPACRTEYEDPGDRRFHAQPNACPACGPQLAFYGRRTDGRSLAPLSTQRHSGAEAQREAGSTAERADGGMELILPADRWPLQVHNWVLHGTEHAALRAAAAALAAGATVAVKGLGGFQLMVDARNAAAVTQLRARKPRPEKPFAVMARDLAQAAQLVHIDPAAEQLLTGPAAPIVLLPRRADSPLAAAVAPGNPNLGVMLPYTPLHHLLLRAVDFPVVATSGNVTDEPICTDEWEALVRLGHAADAFLIHDRPIARHVDDSVVWVVAGALQCLRRARGYAPLPIRVSEPLPTLLGVGAQLKNTIALSIGRQVFLSQHIGDLESAPALAAFERVIADFLRLYAATPVAIAHDLHPDYLSTQWAVAQQAALPNALPAAPQLVPVQHHHAHLAACLAENEHKGSALGIIWDGTGFGPDGTIWGGEFLLGDAAGYQRVAHLRPFRLPGGDAAVREPRRVALALLWELFGESALDFTDLAPVRALDAPAKRVLGQMLARCLNAPATTSAGRLFDGIAALIGLHQVVSFEGQAAMALEFACAPGVTTAYPLPLLAAEIGVAAIQLDWRPLVAAIVEDLHRGVAQGVIAARFHNAAVAAMVEVATRVGAATVALSGGCFQNRRLTEQAAASLRAAGFAVLLHRQTPPNDGGISLGQIAVAARRVNIASSTD